MNNHLIDIDIPHGFRAIQEAHIHLDGIAVVSGINGCGKSTLSKLLYETFKHTLQYESIVISEINDRLSPYREVLAQMQMQMGAVNNERRVAYRLFLRKGESKDSYILRIKDLCEKFRKEEEERDDADSMMSERMWKILRSAVERDDDLVDLESALNIFIQKVSEIVAAGFKMLEERPRNILMKRMASLFQESLSEAVSIGEYGDVFVGTDDGFLPLPHYIKKVAYIDTPMILGLDLFDGPEYWDDLNDLLKLPVANDFNKKIYHTLQTDILHGEAIYDDDSYDEFQFKREDGKTFDLFKCATGIKSFSILQLLLKNGTLTKETLLIIDEPEAHLHPQWIVEYARMVLLLHKSIGVKFFIASHSTDFVGAMKEIAARMNIDDLEFYLAEEAEEMRYSYKELGLDVEPIFESFNKSFAKLDLYASAE